MLDPLQRANLNPEISSYLLFQMIDKGQKPSDSEWYTPSSEPFRFYFTIVFIL
jgi:hypothetical protein